MADATIMNYLISIEEELKKFINFYYTSTTCKFLDIDSDVQNLKDDLIYDDKYKFIHSRIHKKPDFNTLIDIILWLIEKNFKSTFELKLMKNVGKDLQNFRNLITHEKEVTDLLLQRFFESVFFFFQYLKIPDNCNYTYSDFLTKELTLAINTLISINMSNNSFSLGKNYFPQQKIKIETRYNENLFDNNYTKVKLFEFTTDNQRNVQLIDKKKIIPRSIDSFGSFNPNSTENLDVNNTKNSLKEKYSDLLIEKSNSINK